MHKLLKKYVYLLTVICSLCLLAGACTGNTANPPKPVVSPVNRKALAVSYARGGDFAGAIREIKAAELQNPNDPEIHLIKGISYFGLQDLKGTERSYKKALEIKSDYTKARYNLCGLYLKTKNPDAAIEHCSIVTEDIGYPLRYAAFVNIAKAYEFKGDNPSAELFFQKSLKLEPFNIYSRNEYGKMLTRLSREKEAIIHFKTALRYAPKYNEARLNLAVALMKTGDTQSACSEFGAISDSNPSPQTAGMVDRHIENICGRAESRPDKP